jgi:hypothetical protein
MLATTDRRAVATAYRAKGTGIEVADFATRKGLVEHLSCLTPDVHPGHSLAPFLAAMRQHAGRSDGIVVTCEEAAADPEFRRLVAEQDVDSLYLATVNRDGDFRLVRHSARRRTLVCEAKLALEELLVRRLPSSVSLMDAEMSDRLPAIFHEQPFPLLIPCNRFNDRRSWAVPEYGVFEIALDRRLIGCVWTLDACSPKMRAEMRTISFRMCGDSSPKIVCWRGTARGTENGCAWFRPRRADAAVRRGIARCGTWSGTAACRRMSCGYRPHGPGRRPTWPATKTTRSRWCGCLCPSAPTSEPWSAGRYHRL